MSLALGQDRGLDVAFQVELRGAPRAFAETPAFQLARIEQSGYGSPAATEATGDLLDAKKDHHLDTEWPQCNVIIGQECTLLANP